MCFYYSITTVDDTFHKKLCNCPVGRAAYAIMGRWSRILHWVALGYSANLFLGEKSRYLQRCAKLKNNFQEFSWKKTLSAVRTKTKAHLAFGEHVDKNDLKFYTSDVHVLIEELTSARCTIKHKNMNSDLFLKIQVNAYTKKWITKARGQYRTIPRISSIGGLRLCRGGLTS